MARMPSSRPTEKIRADFFLPDEWVEVITFQGAAMGDDIQDALTHVEIDNSSGRAGSVRLTPGNAATERRRQAVVNFCLFEEKDDGSRGPQIPFNDWTRDNMDPRYAQFVDTKVQEFWRKWRVVTGKEGDAQQQATFQEGAPVDAGTPATEEPASQAAG